MLLLTPFVSPVLVPSPMRLKLLAESAATPSQSLVVRSVWLTVFPARIVPYSAALPDGLWTPPPFRAVLPVIVQSVTVTVLALLVKPPP